ncbi:MAG: RuBisCO large subunit C-terminal-like domain-containing protein [Acidobacteria bacterium]|nr:RuBisCO large subunit C-terminal-like domain-containing protein [Acidobacteriota bacterium]MDW7983774.1 RuBisCO large subunit C-terminal-like domain-containing protein [Acidobacteriota bacterium]
MLRLSGERFTVTYRISADSEAEARLRARDICYEQTVELPEDLPIRSDIRSEIVGRIESLRSVGPAAFEAVISYAVETVGSELTQLLNVVFGNISLKPGLRVEALAFPEGFLRHFRGPRFGRTGLREILHVWDRPLLCTALKPMGLSAQEMAELAYEMARAGVDLIKDDHGIADPPFCPFRERVPLCVEAVERANRETGRRAIYMPNVTAPADQVFERAEYARRAGAGGLLVSPGLTGLDTLRALADEDRLSLPLMAHPAFLGGFLTESESGMAHGVLLGQLMRLAGADATIFPNYGGRFAFSREACQAIAEATARPMGLLRPIFPVPAGGMTLDRVPEMVAAYGAEAIFLIGGALLRQRHRLAEAIQDLHRAMSATLGR